MSETTVTSLLEQPSAFGIDPSELRALSGRLADQSAISVDTDDAFTMADEWLRQARDAKKTIDSRFADPLKHLRDASDSLRRLRDEITQPLVEAQDRVSKAMLGYQERKRLAAREAAEREARERERQAREQALAEAAAREEAAERARQAGDEARATMHEAAAEEAVERAAVRVVPQTAKVEKAAVKIAPGTSVRETWGAQLVNMLELAKAVVDGKVSPEVLKLNQIYANRLATLHKADLARQVPGLQAQSSRSLSQRRRP